jgi:predicted NBD/HSP70 family sugar kinase
MPATADEAVITIPGPSGSAPGQPALLRAINDRAALELLILYGPLSRSQIGRLTGLSKPTASQLLARLEEAGLVIPVGPRTSGRTAQLYEVNPGAAYVGALDVSASRIEITVADITGRVVAQHTHRTPGRAGAQAVPAVTAALAAATEIVELDPADLTSIVIGTPGAVNPQTGQLGYAHHLPGWHKPGLVDEIAAAIGVPAEIENDVNLAALAERAYGTAVDDADFVHLWVDAGVGMAIVVGGRLYRGATGGAGEVAYLPVAGQPLPYRLGHSGRGAFQSTVAAPAVLALARQHGVRASTAESALRAAGTPDELFDELGRRFAAGLAAIVATLDPALIVLSGEVSRAGGERLRQRVAAHLVELTIPKPALRLSTVAGNPVLAGATVAALEQARDQVFGSTVVENSAITRPPANAIPRKVHPR